MYLPGGRLLVKGCSQRGEIYSRIWCLRVLPGAVSVDHKLP